MPAGNIILLILKSIKGIIFIMVQLDILSFILCVLVVGFGVFGLMAILYHLIISVLDFLENEW